MTARSSYLSLVLLLTACAGTSKQVVRVARTDLGCDQVQVSEIADNRYAASGCGRDGVYARLCDDHGCSWVRVQSAAETMGTAGGFAPGAPPPVQPQIQQAPLPEQRQIQAAPPPAQRQIQPAPPPAGSPEADDGSSSAPAPDDGSGGAQQPFSPEPTPLSQGELSAPYQAEVPVTPVVQRVEVPPPVPLVEERPLPPMSSYVWVNGYWWWNSPSWVWVTGYWCPPRIGYRYIPGSWYWSSNYWWYGPGGWARPGSTYIAYGHRPRPHRVTTVRAFTPHRVTGIDAARVRGSGPALSRSPSRANSYPAARSVAPHRVTSPSSPPNRVTSPSSSPRSFTPRSSPMYRYPTSLAPGSASSRVRARPMVGAGSPSRAVSKSPASAPRRFDRPLRSGVVHSPGSISRPLSRPSSPSVSPPRRSFGSPGTSMRGSMGAPRMRSSPGPSRAPSRAPSVPRGAPMRARGR